MRRRPPGEPRPRCPRLERELVALRAAEAALAELRRDLVPRAQIERELALRLSALREALERAGDRLVDAVASEPDPAARLRLLRAHLLAQTALIGAPVLERDQSLGADAAGPGTHG